MSTGRTLVAGGSTGPDSSVQAITQTAHGLVVGMPIHMNGEMWQPADADDDDKSADALVDTVIDANNFVARFAGPLTLTTAQWDARTGLSGGLEIGDYYWLSPVAGAIVLDQPTSNLMQTLGVAVSATVLQVRIGEAFSAGVDGSGSGLDADMVDGYHAAEFALKASAETITGAWGFTSQVDFGGGSYIDANGDLRVQRGTTPATGGIYFGNTLTYFYWDGGSYRLEGGQLYITGYVAWHAANDGAGSGLDADLLDGVQGAAYAQKAVAETIAGAWEFSAEVKFAGDSRVNANGDLILSRASNGATGVVYFGTGSFPAQYLHYNGTYFELVGGTGMTINGALTWTSANDGVGSTLDADLLDGQQGAWYQDLANASGNLSTARLNSGTNATTGRFWRGDGLWANGLDGPVEFYNSRTSISANNEAYALSVAWNFEKRLQGKGYWLGVTDAGDAPGLVFANGAGVGRLVLTDDGRLFGSGLHNNATLPTGTNGFLASGTYVPTLTIVANIGGLNTYTWMWTRVGNVVTFSGRIDASPSAAGNCNFAISLPIPSAFTDANQASGTGCDSSFLNEPCSVNSDFTNDRLEVHFKAVSTSARAIFFTGSYLILA